MNGCAGTSFLACLDEQGVARAPCAMAIHRLGQLQRCERLLKVAMQIGDQHHARVARVALRAWACVCGQAVGQACLC